MTDDELRLDYADVDYDLLRAHPKLRQYLYGQSGATGARSRLQIILNAITSAFSEKARPLSMLAATVAMLSRRARLKRACL